MCVFCCLALVACSINNNTVQQQKCVVFEITGRHCYSGSIIVVCRSPFALCAVGYDRPRYRYSVCTQDAIAATAVCACAVNANTEGRISCHSYLFTFCSVRLCLPLAFERALILPHTIIHTHILPVHLKNRNLTLTTFMRHLKSYLFSQY